jgi:hypothetical protein
VTDHVIRHCDGLPFGVQGRNHADYFAEIAAQAERARRDYDLLVLPGLELTYDDADPFESAHEVAVGLRDFVDLDAGPEPARPPVRRSGSRATGGSSARSSTAGPRFSPAPTTCRSCGRPEPAARATP